MKRYFSTHKGVTLIELLIVVAIIGVMAGLALPQVAPIIAGHRLRTANNDLLAKLHAIRTLAITKNRTLELTMNTADQSFYVEKVAYNEYDLINEDQNTQKDILETLAEGGDISGFLLYSEQKEKLHIIPKWDDDGDPIYDVPINYDITATMADPRNGIETMTMKRNSDQADINKIVFYPSGTVYETVVITIVGPAQYGSGQYRIYVYKGGQIRSES